MGILNVTPDSFSDGGLFVDADSALVQAKTMVAEGASIIDVGGESTRPGAEPVSAIDEIQRVVPVIEKIAAHLDTTISIDTSKAEVMQAALDAGANMINDVRALSNEGCLSVARDRDVPICLMHSKGMPRTMQKNPVYKDVVSDVFNYLSERISVCVEAGIDRQRLVVDPGFGFGKTLDHNLALAKQLDRFKSLELPILVGVSRKSMFGAILDAEVEDRLHGCLAMTALLIDKGATIIRTHDVAATVDALKTVQAINNNNSGM